MGCNPEEEEKRSPFFFTYIIPVDRWNDFGKILDVVIALVFCTSHIGDIILKITFPYDILSHG